ncbi:hypothetical protein D3C73_1082700 [compost metagenome]
MLWQLFGQAEAHTHTVADPVERIGQQAPHGDDRGKAEQDRRPLVYGHHQLSQLRLSLVDFQRPSLERAGVAAELLLEIMQRTAYKAQHALLDGGLRLLGGIAQLLQVGQQLGALLVVLQVLDHLVQRFAQGLGGFWLGRRTGAKQARQAGGLYRGDEQKQQQGKATQEGWHREIYLRSNDWPSVEVYVGSFSRIFQQVRPKMPRVPIHIISTPTSRSRRLKPMVSSIRKPNTGTNRDRKGDMTGDPSARAGGML